jgi:general secretion pathway protein I
MTARRPSTRRATRSRSLAPRRARGFTLLEVMIALALLGFALTVLIKSAAGNIFNAQQAHMMGVATDLARGKMYELEEKLLKDGFSDTEQHEEDQAFTDEGWPQVKYSYKIVEVELPSWDALQALAQGQAKGSGAASSGSGQGSGDGKSELTGQGSGGGGFADSALGGMMSQFSGFGGAGAGAGKGSADIAAAAGGAFVQGQYTMFQQILKVSIRKVSLTLKWQVMGSDRDMTVVAFFTDAAGMDKVISGMGSQDLDDQNAKGSGSGSGKGSGSGSAKPPIPGGPKPPPGGPK